MTALTNAERQAAYRARKRNAVSAGVDQVAELVTGSGAADLVDRLDRARHRLGWERLAAARQLNPYRRHIFACRYGSDALAQLEGRYVA